MRTRILVFAFAAAAVLAVVIALARPTSAADTGFKVIVHPKNAISAIDRGFLRDAFLKKAPQWDSGATIRPVDLSHRFAVRDRFIHDVLKKSPAQLKSYWNQQVFSGKGVPPPEADAVSAVISYVLANPGAVGYIPADVNPSGAKVIEVE